MMGRSVLATPLQCRKIFLKPMDYIRLQRRRTDNVAKHLPYLDDADPDSFFIQCGSGYGADFSP
jgi:hypothetical protein